MSKLNDSFFFPLLNEWNRFYLEPASPLKSITNTAQLVTTQKQQLNSATLLTNGTAKSIEENNGNFWSSNGKTNETTHGRWKADFLSSNDNNSLFTNNISTPRNGSSKTNGTTNGLTLSEARKTVIKQNGFHLPPPSSKIQNGTNLFTPDTDFVADFGSANIFDALNNKTSIDNNSTNKTNLLNGNSAAHQTNGVELTNGNQTNGNNGFAMTNGNNSVDDNFADFEHNTIYNAAGEFVSLKVNKMTPF